MNIFYLHKNAKENAKMHCDKHVVKMCTEYAQLLSTAHRVLDGEWYTALSKNNRKINRWLFNDYREEKIYQGAYVNHPCTVWVRESKANYSLLFNLYSELLAEYNYRYGKIHGASKPLDCLMFPPDNILDLPLSELPQCMPDYCKIADKPLDAYRKYYINEKNSFAKWKCRETPEWYT